MSSYIYEKDLRMMKLRVLESPRHRRAVEMISEKSGLGKNRLTKIMVERFDMSLLENLADRYETWERLGESGDGVPRMVGAELFTRYVPLVSGEEMRTICETVERSSKNMTQDEALNAGMKMLKQAVMK